MRKTYILLFYETTSNKVSVIKACLILIQFSKQFVIIHKYYKFIQYLQIKQLSFTTKTNITYSVRIINSCFMYVLRVQNNIVSRKKVFN